MSLRRTAARNRTENKKNTVWHLFLVATTNLREFRPWEEGPRSRRRWMREIVSINKIDRVNSIAGLKIIQQFWPLVHVLLVERKARNLLEKTELKMRFIEFAVFSTTEASWTILSSGNLSQDDYNLMVKSFAYSMRHMIQLTMQKNPFASPLILVSWKGIRGRILSNRCRKMQKLS